MKNLVIILLLIMAMIPSYLISEENQFLELFYLFTASLFLIII